MPYCSSIEPNQANKLSFHLFHYRTWHRFEMRLVNKFCGLSGFQCVLDFILASVCSTTKLFNIMKYLTCFRPNLKIFHATSEQGLTFLKRCYSTKCPKMGLPDKYFITTPVYYLNSSKHFISAIFIFCSAKNI